MTKSSLEVLGKQIHLYMCRDTLFAQKICLKGILKIPCLHWFFLCFGFLETLDPLVLSQMIVNWLLNPCARF